MAFDVRLHAIKTYGSIIHEFDPWFNYRSLEYFEKALRTAYKANSPGKSEKKSVVVASASDVNEAWSQKNSISTLTDRYFHGPSWREATFEKFFKWFDHESW